MKHQKKILIIASDTMITKMLTAALCFGEYEVIICSDRYDKITSIIERKEPSVILIWDAYNAEKILGYIGEWAYADSKLFFIVITCYREVFSLLDKHLPRNAYLFLEPVSTDLLKDIIRKATEGEIIFEHK